MAAANYQDHAAENLRSAIEESQQALRLNPNLPEGYASLGAAYGEAGRNSEAIANTRKALQLAPNLGESWMSLGYIAHYAGLMNTSRNAWQRSIELDQIGR